MDKGKDDPGHGWMVLGANPSLDGGNQGGRKRARIWKTKGIVRPPDGGQEYSGKPSWGLGTALGGSRGERKYTGEVQENNNGIYTLADNEEKE